MPFIELTESNEWIHPRGKRISVSRKLREKHFPLGTKIGIYIDIENKLLGLKPQERGHIISQETIKISKIIKYNIINKRYLAEWNDKHGMLIAQIEFEKNEF